jgi:hypothetical protein
VCCLQDVDFLDGLLGKQLGAVLQDPVVVEDALAGQQRLPRWIGRRRGRIRRIGRLRDPLLRSRRGLRGIRIWQGRQSLQFGDASGESLHRGGEGCDAGGDRGGGGDVLLTPGLSRGLTIGYLLLQTLDDALQVVHRRWRSHGRLGS